MKRIILFLIFYICFFAHSQTWTNVNGRWGYDWLRTSRALFMPSGNGAPSGTASLRGAGYKLQAAFYADTTNKKVYVFQPKDSTWLDITAVAGVVSPVMGGTGLTTVTTGDLLYGSATNTWAKLSDIATGNALISGGVTTAPAWGKIGLTTHVSGILPVGNGGTGTATPGLIQGANITITGSWPNQTINSTGGGGGTLQTVTDLGNTTTNDIIIGARTNSVGRFSVEKTFTSLNVHAFDDYSTLNPSSGGFGYGTFDASGTMIGSQTNDHFVGYQSRLTIGAGSTTNIDGAYGLTGILVFNHHPGSGTVTNAHGIYIKGIDGGGAITNAYGIRIENVISGTNNYAIKSEGGKSSFAGEVMIGPQSTPIAALDVRSNTQDITQYTDNTKAGGNAATFNSSNAAGGSVCLDITASGAGGSNKGLSFAASSMTSADWNYYANNSSKFYNKGKVGIGNAVTSPDSTLQVNGSIHNNAGVRFEGLPTAAGTKAVRIDANGTLSIADTTINSGNLYYSLDKQYTDANNTGTSATDLYTYTIPANTLSTDGNTITFETSGTTNDATATVDMEILFAGNGIGGAGALSITATGNWNFRGYIIRTSSSTARIYSELTMDGLTNKLYQTTANITSLNFTVTNILKITGQAGGAGGGSNDITGRTWMVDFKK